MRAQMLGGPFDGTLLQIPDGRREVAVAYDHNGNMISGYPDLQRHVEDPEFFLTDPNYDKAAALCIYQVDYYKSGSFVRFSHTRRV